MIYKWKEGRSYPISVEVANSVIESVRDEHGVASPSRLVEVSKPKDAPLHNLFEWNNDAAAEHYRERQARDIIGAVHVIREPGEPAVRGWVHLPSDGPYSFRDTMSAMSNKSTRQELLSIAKRDLLIWRNKYANLNELAVVFETIDIELQKSNGVSQCATM